MLILQPLDVKQGLYVLYIKNGAISILSKPYGFEEIFKVILLLFDSKQISYLVVIFIRNSSRSFVLVSLFYS